MHWMNAGKVSYTKEETKSLSEKNCQGLQPKVARPAALEDFSILSSLGRDRFCSLAKPPFHQNSHCTQGNSCPSKNLIHMEDHTRACTWSAMRPWEVWLKEPWRRQHSRPDHHQTPSTRIYPQQKEDSDSPSPSLTEVQPLPGLGRSPLQSPALFTQGYSIKMANFNSQTLYLHQGFLSPVWSKVVREDEVKRKR